MKQQKKEHEKQILELEPPTKGDDKKEQAKEQNPSSLLDELFQEWESHERGRIINLPRWVQ